MSVTNPEAINLTDHADSILSLAVAAATIADRLTHGSWTRDAIGALYEVGCVLFDPFDLLED